MINRMELQMKKDNNKATGYEFVNDSYLKIKQ